MKTRSLKIIVSLFILLSTVTANAIFVPVPMEEGKSWSLNFGVDPIMYFSPGYTLRHLGASASATYNVWEGLDFGLQARGGVNDGTNGLFNGLTTYTGDIGGDVMARYLIKGCHFFIGLQTIFGYDYLFNNTGSFSTNSSLSLAIGVPMGIHFDSVVSAYLTPAVEFGGRSPADILANGNSWGSLVSVSAALGASINLGGPLLIIELAPRIDDFNNVTTTTGLRTFIGLGFEI